MEVWSQHPKELIIGDPTYGVRTHSSLRDVYNHFIFISHFEPKIIDEAEKDYNWINAMQEELNQFKRNNVWSLVSKLKNYPVIDTK